MIQRLLTTFGGLLASICLSLTAQAQSGSETFGDYQVYYSVFNSTFVRADIASTYQLNRARDRALVNVSVIRTGGDGSNSGEASNNGEASSLGLPAEVSGTASNLLQQTQNLEFREIDEGDATYYIATVRHTDEEMYNFRLQIQPQGAERPFELSFSQKLYVEK